jgi:hypothetical protein
MKKIAFHKGSSVNSWITPDFEYCQNGKVDPSFGANNNCEVPNGEVSRGIGWNVLVREIRLWRGKRISLVA